MKNIIFGIFSVIFFILYYNGLLQIFNSYVPLNATTNVISMFVILFVVVPFSVISAQISIDVIDKHE